MSCSNLLAYMQFEDFVSEPGSDEEAWDPIDMVGRPRPAPEEEYVVDPNLVIVGGLNVIDLAVF